MQASKKWRRKVSSTLLNTDLTPHAPREMERALVASVLLQGTKAFATIREINRLGAQDFYLEDCAVLWRSFEDLVDQGLDIDILTVQAELEARNLLEAAGGRQALYQLQDPGNMPSAGLATSYAVKIREMAQRRRLLETASFIGRMAHADQTPMDEVYREVLASVDGLTAGRARPFVTAKVGIDAAYERHKRAAAQFESTGAPVRGLVSGLDGFDRLCQYQFDLGTLMILFGVTGLGKSTLLCDLMRGYASRGTPVLYVTLEMDPERIVDRVVAGAAGIPENTLRSGDMSAAQWEAYGGAMEKLELMPWTVTAACSSADDIEDQVGAMTEFHGGRRGVVMIDTLNSMDEAGKSDNPYIQITNAVKGLDRLKLRSGWALIGAGQQRMDYDPSAGVKKLRQMFRPNPANIQGSRELSQKAEFQLGMYSWEYWHDKLPWFDDPEAHAHGEMRIDNVKSRYCQDGVFTVLQHRKGIPCFQDVANPGVHDAGDYDEGQPSISEADKRRADAKAADRQPILE